MAIQREKILNKTNWEGLPYFPISQFYKNYFLEKVVKIPVALASDCPNRRGLKGMEACIFCDVHGSFAFEKRESEKKGDISIVEQIVEHRDRIIKTNKARKYMVYFQAYTTTFIDLKKLKKACLDALEVPDVVGIVIGTRPDFLSDALYDFWQELSSKTFLSIEIGVQSFNNDYLKFMKRGHTAEQSINTIKKIADFCPEINLGIHLMFGWPNETSEEMKKTAELCNSLPIHNVKLHNLHVLKNTELESYYLKNEFKPLEREAYADLVGVFLKYLSPKFSVHRLSAFSAKQGELVSPKWTGQRMANYQYFIDYLKSKQIWQGQSYENDNR